MKKTKIVYLIIGLIAFTYVLIRAYSVGITYDESWTMYGFVPQSFWNIITCTPCDANNHIMNTLLIKLFFYFGNHSLFIARLPNVLALLLFIFYAYKLTNSHLSPLMGLCCFLLFLLNPFLLDFFSLARGYGLSLGFQMASLYYFLQMSKTYKASNTLLTLMFGGLGVLSNLSSLNYWLAILALIVLVPLLLKKGKELAKNSLIGFLAATVMLVILYEPVRKLIASNSLYYGGNTSFYSDTLISLTKYSMYSTEAFPLVFLVLNIFLTVLLVAVIVSYFYNRKLLTAKNLILACLFLSIASVISQHYLFGNLYLIDRTALFFYPMFITLLCLSLNDISQKYLGNTAIIAVVAAFCINGYLHFNLYKTATWYFDAHSTKILTWVNNQGAKKGKIMRLDFSWPLESSLGYYAQQNKYPFVAIVKTDRLNINRDADYYIYLYKSLEKVGYEALYKGVLPRGNDTVMSFPDESLYLFANPPLNRP